jgi:TetR/AcrR family transcriptional repressor of lmrAB and yxaGH operons
MANDTRARMIEATGRLVQLRGYHGTTLNDVLAESGAPRGSLYFHFPGGKDQLVLESTRAAVARVTERRRSILEAETPAAALRELARTTAARMRETDFALSCPVAPIVLDGTSDTSDLTKLCRESLKEWIGLLYAAFVRAGISEDRAQSLAILVQSALEGALLIARAYRDVDPILVTANELAALLDAEVQRDRADRRVTRAGGRPKTPAH